MTNSIKTLNRFTLVCGVLLITTVSALLSNRFEHLAPTAHAATEYTWTGTASAEWFNPENWSPNGVPGVADVATISRGIVNIRSNVVPDDVTVFALNLSGGQIQGDGKLTVTGTMNWTAGTMGDDRSGSGMTVIAQGATLNLSTQAIKIFGARTVTNNGTINISGVGSGFGFCGHEFIINNAGTIDFGEGASFTVCNGSPGTINNTGTLKKSSGSDVTMLTHALNNNGAVEVLSGELRLGTFSNNTNSSGTFNVAPATTLNFLSGTFNLTASSALRGAGNVTFASTEVCTINGSYEVTGTTAVSAGTTNFNRDISTPTLVFSAGRIQGAGKLTVTGTMNWTGGTLGEDSGGTGTTVIAQGATSQSQHSSH
jgi:hypothetical protein